MTSNMFVTGFCDLRTTEPNSFLKNVIVFFVKRGGIDQVTVILSQPSCTLYDTSTDLGTDNQELKSFNHASSTSVIRMIISRLRGDGGFARPRYLPLHQQS